MASTSTASSTSTYHVLSLNANLVPVTLTSDALLSSLLHQATINNPASILPLLRLCFDRAGREPDILSVISEEVLSAVSVRDFLDRRLVEGGRFAVVLHVPLHSLCRINPIPCLANHATTVGSVKRQFLAAWHRRHKLPIDTGRTVAMYKDHSRTTEWSAVKEEAIFIMYWLLHEAQSPLHVRVRDGIEETEDVSARQVDKAVEAVVHRKELEDGEAVSENEQEEEEEEEVGEVSEEEEMVEDEVAGMAEEREEQEEAKAVAGEEEEDEQQEEKDDENDEEADEQQATTLTTSTASDTEAARLLAVYRATKRYYRLSAAPRDVRRLIYDRLKAYIQRQSGPLTPSQAYPAFRLAQLRLLAPDYITIRFLIYELQLAYVERCGPMQADVDSTVDQLMAKAPYSHAARHITYNGRTLPGHATLRACNVASGAELHVVLWPLMQIFVRVEAGRTLTLAVHAQQTVEQVKQLVHNKAGIPPDQQRLVHASRQLDGGRKLADYGVKKEATLHLMMKWTK